MKSAILSSLLLLVATPLALQAKETLGVSPVVASPSLLQSVKEAGSNVALGRVMDSLDVQLLQALNETGRFTIVERQNLQPILQEQAIGASGNIAPDTAAAAFRLTGADYLLILGIDDFQDFVDSATFANISREIERRKVRIGGVARLYNTATGTLRSSVAVSVEETDVQEYFTMGQRQGDTTQAIYSAIARLMASQVANGLADSLYPARVLAKTGNQITLNRGEGTGIAPGQVWLVFATGEEMIDPDTGESLGQEEIMLGSAEIVRVSARTAQAILSEDNGVAQGHILRPR